MPIFNALSRSVLTPIAGMLLITVGVCDAAVADEVVAKETLDYNDDVVKLQSTRDQAIERQRSRSVSALTSIAKARARSGKEDEVEKAWLMVLKLDRENEDARAYFTEKGTLEKILKDLDKPVTTDLLGQELK